MVTTDKTINKGIHVASKSRGSHEGPQNPANADVSTPPRNSRQVPQLPLGHIETIEAQITPRGRCPVHGIEHQQEVKRINYVLSTVYRDVHGPGINSIQHRISLCPTKCAKHQTEINRIKLVLSKLHKDVRILKHQLSVEAESETNPEPSELDTTGSDDSLSTPEANIRKSPEALFSGEESWHCEQPTRSTGNQRKRGMNSKKMQSYDWFGIFNHPLSILAVAAVLVALLYPRGKSAFKHPWLTSTLLLDSVSRLIAPCRCFLTGIGQGRPGPLRTIARGTARFAIPIPSIPSNQLATLSFISVLEHA